jgi:GTP:adenosylcobinamide-phosphate guanylyltransferase
MTFDEETNIGGCLDSCLNFVNDIKVLDSYSTDKTSDIVSNYSVEFYQNKFEGYATQRNFGLNTLSYSNEWVLMLDADERLTKELHEEILEKLSIIDDEYAIGSFRRRDIFRDQWLRRSSGYPTWFNRLVRLGRVIVDREINEEYKSDGRTFYLSEHIDHYPFNKGISWWVERHNRYSSMEAVVLEKTCSTEIDFSNLVNRNKSIVRAEMKKILYKLPFRPVIVFVYLYIIRLGLLDGKAGLDFAILRMFYEILINLKLKESSKK